MCVTRTSDLSPDHTASKSGAQVEERGLLRLTPGPSDGPGFFPHCPLFEVGSGKKRSIAGLEWGRRGP